MVTYLDGLPPPIGDLRRSNVNAPGWIQTQKYLSSIGGSRPVFRSFSRLKADSVGAVSRYPHRLIRHKVAQA